MTKHALLKALRNLPQAVLVGLIRLYQAVVSPALPSRCKYYPSCSHYALDAVRDYGAFRGFVLAVWRVLRCNPLSYGGYDPVSKQRLFQTRPGLQEAVPAPEAESLMESDASRLIAGRAGHGHSHLVRG